MSGINEKRIEVIHRHYQKVSCFRDVNLGLKFSFHYIHFFFLSFLFARDCNHLFFACSLQVFNLNFVFFFIYICVFFYHSSHYKFLFKHFSRFRSFFSKCFLLFLSHLMYFNTFVSHVFLLYDLLLH